MRRDTAIGQLFRTDPDAAVAELRKVIVRCRGNLLHTAHEAGLSRRHLYRYIYAGELWPVVNEERRKRARKPASPHDWRQAVCAALREGCAGLRSP